MTGLEVTATFTANVWEVCSICPPQPAHPRCCMKVVVMLPCRQWKPLMAVGCMHARRGRRRCRLIAPCAEASAAAHAGALQGGRPRGQGSDAGRAGGHENGVSHCGARLRPGALPGRCPLGLPTMHACTGLADEFPVAAPSSDQADCPARCAHSCPLRCTGAAARRLPWGCLQPRGLAGRLSAVGFGASSEGYRLVAAQRRWDLARIHATPYSVLCWEQVKAVRVEGSQLTQQGDVLVVLEPSEE